MELKLPSAALRSSSLKVSPDLTAKVAVAPKAVIRRGIDAGAFKVDQATPPPAGDTGYDSETVVSEGDGSYNQDKTKEYLLIGGGIAALLVVALIVKRKKSV